MSDNGYVLLKVGLGWNNVEWNKNWCLYENII